MFTEEDRALLHELVDREKIRDCIMRYATGIDRCDPELIKSAYWPDAHDVHGDFEGSGEEFVQWIMPLLRTLVRTQHFHGNSTIRIEGRFAKVQTYTINWHTIVDSGNSRDHIHAGRYLDTFEKRGSEWKVIDRFVIFDWVMENPKSVDFSKGMMGRVSPEAAIRATSKRFPEDPLYTHLGGLSAGGFLGIRA